MVEMDQDYAEWHKNLEKDPKNKGIINGDMD